MELRECVCCEGYSTLVVPFTLQAQLLEYPAKCQGPMEQYHSYRAVHYCVSSTAAFWGNLSVHPGPPTKF